MNDGVRVEPGLVRGAALLLTAAAGIRLLGSIVAGFLEWHDASNGPFPGGRPRAFDVLTTFGAAGDGTGVLLLVAAAAAVWWLGSRGEPLADVLTTWTSWLFGATGLLALAQGVGVGLVYPTALGGNQTSRLVQAEAFAPAYVVLAVGAIVLLNRLRVGFATESASDDLDAFIFAVDRKSGDVRAFLSAGEAKRRIHVYSVEDDEFAFYTDEGTALAATVVDDRIVLRPTDQQRLGELVESLKEFANRRGITIDDEDADDPTAYAVPIGRWHWLEMWPPWMRPIGMLFRSRR